MDATTQSKEDRIEQLEEAREKIEEAIQLIRDALRGTQQADSAEAYIIGHLQNWAEGDNPYDETIPKLIEELREGNEEED